MTSKKRVLAKHPAAVALREVGSFAGGRIRYVVKLTPTARKTVGLGQRESSAWADARRTLGM